MTELAGVALWAPALAQAAHLIYTDAAAFDAALPGTATTLDFEGEVGGTPISTGGTLGDAGGVNVELLAGEDCDLAHNLAP